MSRDQIPGWPTSRIHHNMFKKCMFHVFKWFYDSTWIKIIQMNKTKFWFIKITTRNYSSLSALRTNNQHNCIYGLSCRYVRAELSATGWGVHGSSCPATDRSRKERFSTTGSGPQTNFTSLLYSLLGNFSVCQLFLWHIGHFQYFFHHI